MRSQPQSTHKHFDLGENDLARAKEAFSYFYEYYGESLYLVLGHLERIISMTHPDFAVAYKPWHDLLEQFVDGIESLGNDEILHEPLIFHDAMKVFLLESAAYFLRDACISAGYDVDPAWDVRFHDNMRTLSAAYSVIRRHQLLD